MIALALDILTTAAILFIVASGLLIVFGVMKIINFAHGAFMTVGAYAALITSNLGLPAIMAPFLAFVLGGVLGAAAEFVIVRRLYHRPLDAILARVEAEPGAGQKRGKQRADEDRNRDE